MKLGKGIPLTLPDICGEEIPSKSDFDDIKFFKIEEETQDTFLKLEKETDTVVFEKEETCIKTNKKLDNFMKTNLISQKNKEPPEVYVLDVEEV